MYDWQAIFLIPGTSVEATDTRHDDRLLIADAVGVYASSLACPERDYAAIVDAFSEYGGSKLVTLPSVGILTSADVAPADVLTLVREALADFIARREDAAAYVARGYAKMSWWSEKLTAPKIAEVQDRVTRAREILATLTGIATLSMLDHNLRPLRPLVTMQFYIPALTGSERRIEVHTNPTHSRFVAVMSSDHGEIRSAVRETCEAATAEVREEYGKRRMVAYVARLDKRYGG